MDRGYSIQELMVVTAAREIRDGEVVFVGIGLPSLAATLAQRTHAPNSILIFESGVIGAKPSRLILSVGDPALASKADMIVDFFDVFSVLLQGGYIDVGFLSGAQVDKYGNLNSTVIGDYEKPKVRLPGSGGACEIASMSKRLLIIMPHEKRRFVEKVDFITSPGFLSGRAERGELGLIGKGPSAVITTLGVLRFDEKGEMYLDSVHPGVDVDEVKANTGWDLKVADEVKTTKPPTEEELRILREELDPKGIFLRRGAT